MKSRKKWYIGLKPYDHDSGFIGINPEKKEVFGYLLERKTRIKHDSGLIFPLLSEIPQKSVISSGFSWHDFQLPLTNSMLEGETRKIIVSKKKTYFQKIKEIYNKKGILKIIRLFLDRFYVIFPRLLKTSGIKYSFDKILKKRPDLILDKFYDHHLCHAASAYYLYPFKSKKVCVVTLDGKGDGYFSKVFLVEDGIFKEISASIDKYSIGELYSDFTEVLGVVRNSDEGKVEALACYGKPNQKLLEILEKSYKITPDLKITMTAETPEWLKYPGSKKLMTHLMKWRKKIGDKSFSAVIQKFLEDIGVEYIKAIQNKLNINSFAFAGGIFANVKLNLKIIEDCKPKEIFITPPMGDDGTALGAAILSAIKNGEKVDWLINESMPYWGPQYTKNQVLDELKKDKWNNIIKYEDIRVKWYKNAAELISKGEIIAVFQGKMEFGPRALGNRSVLADPRKKETRDRINSTIKRRPWYQPFCPSVLEEERERLFEKSYSNKHMTCAFRMKKKFWEILPSAMHVDGTARPQFVSKEDNENYYNLIKEFKKIAGYGILVDTSFNLHGRAMVMTPAQAIQDFLDCGLDALYIEGFKVRRKSNEK